MTYVDYDDTGVYAIMNTVTGDCYIGVSRGLHERFLEHKCDLRKHKHHSARLQDAWDAYGAECFTFTVLQQFESEDSQWYSVSPRTLSAAEAEWCHALRPAYNSKPPRRYPSAMRNLVTTRLIAEFVRVAAHGSSILPRATGRSRVSTWYQPGI